MIETDSRRWAVVWHRLGALHSVKLVDYLRAAQTAVCERGQFPDVAVVALSESLEAAQETIREIKRRRRAIGGEPADDADKKGEEDDGEDFEGADSTGGAGAHGEPGQE